MPKVALKNSPPSWVVSLILETITFELTEELNQDQNFLMKSQCGPTKEFFYKLRGQLGKKSLKLLLYETEGEKVQGWLIFICGLVLVKSQLPVRGSDAQVYAAEGGGGIRALTKTHIFVATNIFM
jgi:hypothetical protein